MKKTLLIALAIFFALAINSFGASTGKITIRVVGDDGKPIAGAKAYISYSKPGRGGIGVADMLKEGFTNNEGLFTAESSTINSIGLSAEKEGYYHSGIHYEFKSSSFLLNRWEPWNPTIEVVLKKKRNPVPMVVNGGIIKLPKLDSPVGYDLENGDWVAPYGSGATSDFIFTFHAVSRAYADYECNFTLTFSNEADGIQEYYFDEKDQSSYRWPFMAPETGYLSKLYREKSDNPQSNFKSNEKKSAHYIYRVRSKKDNDGKIVGANYGIIRKEFEFGPNGTILFGSLFNPDTTRNLEEDPKKNLFKKK
ncbi:MAG: hypothetical protein HGA96_17400 [Desulfobulbaceae bacterium]|nr:hypothetical protein [Desulfobulbaceae bacterium]